MLTGILKGKPERLLVGTRRGTMRVALQDLPPPPEKKVVLQIRIPCDPFYRGAVLYWGPNKGFQFREAIHTTGISLSCL